MFPGGRSFRQGTVCANVSKKNKIASAAFLKEILLYFSHGRSGGFFASIHNDVEASAPRQLPRFFPLVAFFELWFPWNTGKFWFVGVS